MLLGPGCESPAEFLQGLGEGGGERVGGDDDRFANVFRAEAINLLAVEGFRLILVCAVPVSSGVGFSGFDDDDEEEGAVAVVVCAPDLGGEEEEEGGSAGEGFEEEPNILARRPAPELEKEWRFPASFLVDVENGVAAGWVCGAEVGGKVIRGCRRGLYDGECGCCFKYLWRGRQLQIQGVRCWEGLAGMVRAATTWMRRWLWV